MKEIKVKSITGKVIEDGEIFSQTGEKDLEKLTPLLREMCEENKSLTEIEILEEVARLVIIEELTSKMREEGRACFSGRVSVNTDSISQEEGEGILRFNATDNLGICPELEIEVKYEVV